MTHDQWIVDHEKAQAAYEAVKVAMGAYDRFGNDKDKTVTIDTGDTQTTLRVESLVAVSLDDLTLGENAVVERCVWDANIKAKVTARLATAA